MQAPTLGRRSRTSPIRRSFRLHSFGSHGDYIPVLAWYVNLIRHINVELVRGLDRSAGQDLLSSVERGEVLQGAAASNSWIHDTINTGKAHTLEVVPTGFPDPLGSVIKYSLAPGPAALDQFGWQIPLSPLCKRLLWKGEALTSFLVSSCNVIRVHATA